MNRHPIPVFVYGTLKPGEANYQFYCAGKVQKITGTYTKGQLFSLPFGYPAMTPGEGRVEGVLLEFSDPKVLDLLDQLEDYDPQRSVNENEYNRQRITVYQLSNEIWGQAWAYLMSPEKVRQFGGVCLPQGYWSGLIRDAN